MLETITFHALDVVTNPILVCELDGTLLYKNEETEKRLQVPHVKKKINVHLTKHGRETLKNYRDALPAFVEYLSEGESITAFVDVVYYERRPMLLFVFSHLFDFSCLPRTRFLSPADFPKKLTGNKILSLATAAYTRSDLPIALRNRQGHIVATRVFKKLISTVLTELYYGGETLRYSLNYANEIIAYACRKILTRFGLDVLFPILDQEKSGILIDFKPFALLFSHLLILLAEVAEYPTAEVEITEEENAVLYSVTASVKEKERRIFTGGVEAFSHVLPGSALDLYFFESLCQNEDFRFDFSLTPKERDNLILRLRVPIERKYTVSERIERDKAIVLALIDLYAEKLD